MNSPTRQRSRDRNGRYLTRDMQAIVDDAKTLERNLLEATSANSRLLATQSDLRRELNALREVIRNAQTSEANEFERSIKLAAERTSLRVLLEEAADSTILGIFRHGLVGRIRTELDKPTTAPANPKTDDSGAL